MTDTDLGQGVSQLVQHPTTADGLSRWELLITHKDSIEMHPEQIEMIKDGLWLISQALGGRIEGPLTLPNSRLPLRSETVPVKFPLSSGRPKIVSASNA